MDITDAAKAELNRLRALRVHDNARCLRLVTPPQWAGDGDFGIGIDEVFSEVHDSNMSKLDENGQPIYSELGKVMKGPHYFEPKISTILLKQRGWRFHEGS